MRNSYLNHPEFDSLYVRKGAIYIDKNWVYGFQIANITATKPGNKAFERLIKQILEINPNIVIYVELVHNERFRAKLTRMGFDQTDKDSMCYVLNKEKYKNNNE